MGRFLIASGSGSFHTRSNFTPPGVFCSVIDKQCLKEIHIMFSVHCPGIKYFGFVMKKLNTMFQGKWFLISLSKNTHKNAYSHAQQGHRNQYRVITPSLDRFKENIQFSSWHPIYQGITDFPWDSTLIAIYHSFTMYTFPHEQFSYWLAHQFPANMIAFMGKNMLVLHLVIELHGS